MTEKELRRISDALSWYEGTDGSEREEAAAEMYCILCEQYKKEILGKK